MCYADPIRNFTTCNKYRSDKYVLPNTAIFYSSEAYFDVKHASIRSVKKYISFIEFQKLQIHSVSGFIEAVDPTTVAVITIGNNAHAIKGVTIKIKCPHIAVPPAKISWLVNSKEIEKNDRSFVQEKGTDALLIQKMSEKYTGIYTCRGEQNGQITEASSHLQFIGNSFKFVLLLS